MEDLRSGFGMVATVHDVIDGTRLLNSEGEGSVAVKGLLTILRTDPLTSPAQPGLSAIALYEGRAADGQNRRRREIHLSGTPRLAERSSH